MIWAQGPHHQPSPFPCVIFSGFWTSASLDREWIALLFTHSALVTRNFCNTTPRQTAGYRKLLKVLLQRSRLEMSELRKR